MSARVGYALAWLALALATIVTLLVIEADGGVVAVVGLAWFGGIVSERLYATRWQR